MDYQKLTEQPEYAFLKNNERLGSRIMLLGLGGSYAYGTNNEHSDIDLGKYGVEKNEMISAIMFEINKECVSAHYEIA